MKNLVICICCLLIFLAPACSKVKEKAEDAKGLLATVKNMQSIQKNAKQITKSMEQAKKIELTEKNLTNFYTNIKKLNSKYPDIDFNLSPAAAIALSMQGKNLKKIISTESSLDYDEYNALSMAIMKAIASSASQEMTESIHRQMKASEQQMARQDLSNATPEAKASMQQAIAEVHQQILELEKKMQAEDFVRNKNQRAMIERVRKNVGL